MNRTCPKTPQTRIGRAIALAGLTLVLGSCSVGSGLETAVSAARPLAVHDVFYVTTRTVARDDQLFSRHHSDRPAYGKISVGIPLTHKPGQLKLASGVPDPARHMHTRDVIPIPSLNAFVDESVRGRPGVMIFVHGYNTSFIESIYRFAQIAHDSDLPAAPIQFSWASAGDTRAYFSDRDRAVMSRYALADLIGSVVDAAPDRIVLVAHSMGSLPLMEALVLLSSSTRQSLGDRITEILLVSPDLDVGLFASQLARTSLPPEKIAVAINREDKLLKLSSIVAGGNARLGNHATKADFAAMGVRTLDVTGIRDGDRPGHFLPATSPTLLEAFRTYSPQ